MSVPALLGRDGETARLAESLQRLGLTAAMRVSARRRCSAWRREMRRSAALACSARIGVPSSIEKREPRGRFFIVSPVRGMLDELVQLLDSNELRVIVERTFSLGEARQAYEFGQREHARGKVVLQVRGGG